MKKSDKARNELIQKYKYDDDIQIYPDAVVDDSPDNGSWVTAQIWVYADDEDI